MELNEVENAIDDLVTSRSIQKITLTLWECQRYETIIGDWYLECVQLEDSEYVIDNRMQFAYRIMGPTVQFPWAIGKKVDLLCNVGDLLRDIPQLYEDLGPEPPEDRYVTIIAEPEH